MSNDQYFIEESRSSGVIYRDETIERKLMLRVFLWMTVGLALTGVAAIVAVNNGFVNLVLTSSGLFFGLIIAQFLAVIGLSSMISRMSSGVATFIFGLYSVLNGLTFSTLFLIYSSESIATVFFITAATFGSMALYGYFTKRDLSSWGSLLFMALIGIVIASLVNIFLGNTMLYTIISAVGVIIFVGLTAYDTQKIKTLFVGVAEDSEDVKKVSILGALTLYLDFINLFIMLLRLLGSRRS